SSGSSNLKITECGTVMGTPLYMSPEQCLGKEVDARSDLYSLGCVMFEMLAGRTPFNAESVKELLDHHVGTPAPCLRRFIPFDREPLSELARVIAKALDKRPSRRYQTAAELQAVLISLQERACDDECDPRESFLQKVIRIDNDSKSLT